MVIIRCLNQITSSKSGDDENWTHHMDIANVYRLALEHVPPNLKVFSYGNFNKNPLIKMLQHYNLINIL